MANIFLENENFKNPAPTPSPIFRFLEPCKGFRTIACDADREKNLKVRRFWYTFKAYKVTRKPLPLSIQLGAPPS